MKLLNSFKVFERISFNGVKIKNKYFSPEISEERIREASMQRERETKNIAPHISDLGLASVNYQTRLSVAMYII